MNLVRTLEQLDPSGPDSTTPVLSAVNGGTFRVTKTGVVLGAGSGGTVEKYRITTTLRDGVTQQSFDMAGKKHRDKYEEAVAGYFAESERLYERRARQFGDVLLLAGQQHTAPPRQHVLNPDIPDPAYELLALRAPALNLHKYVSRTTIVVEKPNLYHKSGLLLSELMTGGCLTAHIRARPKYYSTERIVKVSTEIQVAINHLIQIGYGYFDSKANNIGVKLTNNVREPYRGICIDAGSMGEKCPCTYVSLLSVFGITSGMCYLLGNKPCTVIRTVDAIDSTIINEATSSSGAGLAPSEYIKFTDEYSDRLRSITPGTDEGRKNMLRLIVYCQTAILRAEMLGRATDGGPRPDLLDSVDKYSNRHVVNMFGLGLDKHELVTQYNEIVAHTRTRADGARPGENFSQYLTGLDIFAEVVAPV